MQEYKRFYCQRFTIIVDLLELYSIRLYIRYTSILLLVNEIIQFHKIRVINVLN